MFWRTGSFHRMQLAAATGASKSKAQQHSLRGPSFMRNGEPTLCSTELPLHLIPR